MVFETVIIIHHNLSIVNAFATLTLECKVIPPGVNKQGQILGVLYLFAYILCYMIKYIYFLVAKGGGAMGRQIQRPCGPPKSQEKSGYFPPADKKCTTSPGRQKFTNPGQQKFCYPPSTKKCKFKARPGGGGSGGGGTCPSYATDTSVCILYNIHC